MSEFTETKNDYLNTLRNNFLEYKKLQTRISRHGNMDTVLPCGRKKLSPEHHAETYRKTLERRKEQRRLKAIEQGRRPGYGRPVKLQIETENENVNLISV